MLQKVSIWRFLGNKQRGQCNEFARQPGKLCGVSAIWSHYFGDSIQPHSWATFLSQPAKMPWSSVTFDSMSQIHLVDTDFKSEIGLAAANNFYLSKHEKDMQQGAHSSDPYSEQLLVLLASLSQHVCSSCLSKINSGYLAITLSAKNSQAARLQYATSWWEEAKIACN